jgi:hypothetical protein
MSKKRKKRAPVETSSPVTETPARPRRSGKFFWGLAAGFTCTLLVTIVMDLGWIPLGKRARGSPDDACSRHLRENPRRCSTPRRWAGDTGTRRRRLDARHGSVCISVRGNQGAERHMVANGFESSHLGFIAPLVVGGDRGRSIPSPFRRFAVRGRRSARPRSRHGERYCSGVACHVASLGS